MTRNDPEGDADRFPAVRDVDEDRGPLIDQRVALLIGVSEVGRRLRTHEQKVVPRDLRLWLRQFLKPAVVREAAIVDRRIRFQLKLETGWPLAVGRWPNRC